ncbi:MAG: PorV/PorQ family protein [Candidatus Eisenbacteria bacterium]|nr:PorV/PorQ family protein [Candidatus Eisenbacteria bacterium]
MNAKIVMMRASSALLLVIAACAVRPASAGIENAGTTGANFLSLGTGAGVFGMGGAGLGTFNDLSSIQWNVASLGSLDESQIVFSHAPLAGTGAQDWVGYGGRMGTSATRWAVNGIYQGDGSFEGRDALGNPTGSFNASSMAFGATLAHPFGEIATFGLGGKVVTEKLGDASGFGGTFDAGLQMQRGPFGFGVAAQNVGGRMKYGDLIYAMPGNIGAGVSFANPASGLRFALDYNHPSAYYPDLRGGVEWMWRGRLALRTGYRHELGASSTEMLNGPTFGMGAGVRGLWFDYGYMASSNGDGQHRIALRLNPHALNGAMGLNETHADAATAKETPHTADLVPPAPKSAPVVTKSETPAAKSEAPPAPKSATAAQKSEAPATKSAPVATAAAPPVVATAAPRGKQAHVVTSVEPEAPPVAPAPRAIQTPHAQSLPAPSTPIAVEKPIPAPASTMPDPEAVKPAPVTEAPVKPATVVVAPAKAAPVVETRAKPAPVVVAPAKVAPKPEPRPDKIKLKPGDTLASIARRYNTTVPALMMENNLVTPQVKVGQTLKIPDHQ